MEPYPLFGPEIKCPHCRQRIPALLLTDAYLCPMHGAFEVDNATGELVHLNSDHRRWRLWEGEWYRQHTHPDGIRFEIHESLDRLYTKGFRATKITIARRYASLITPYLDRSNHEGGQRLYGLPVEFSPPETVDPKWAVVNFELEKEWGVPKGYPYFRSF